MYIYIYMCIYIYIHLHLELHFQVAMWQTQCHKPFPNACIVKSCGDCCKRLTRDPAPQKESWRRLTQNHWVSMIKLNTV